MTSALNIIKVILAWGGLIGGAVCLFLGVPQAMGLFALSISASLAPNG